MRHIKVMHLIFLDFRMSSMVYFLNCADACDGKNCNERVNVVTLHYTDLNKDYIKHVNSPFKLFVFFQGMGLPIQHCFSDNCCFYFNHY